MPLLTLIASLAAICLVAVLFVVPRRFARREAGPVSVLASGPVPAAQDWVPTALQTFARPLQARATWSDLLDGGRLSGHQGEVAVAGSGIRLTATMQPHPFASIVARGQPLRIRVELAETPLRGGLGRAVFGPRPTGQALELRRRLQAAIGEQARSVGAAASTPRGTSTAAVTWLCAILLGGAVALTLVSLTADRIGSWLDSTPSASPSPAPSLPAGASLCEPTAPSDQPPRRSAAARGTSCAFAEVVRAAYLVKAGGAPKVTLKSLAEPKSGKRITMTCTVATEYVRCSGGSKPTRTVWLY